MLHAKHHHPPHLFRNNSVYFITARTIGSIQESQRQLEKGITKGIEVSDYRLDSLNCSQRYFYYNNRKNLFIKVISISKEKFNINVYAWALLDNHYHLLIQINKKETLSKFIQNLHVNSARLLNRLDNKKGRKIWYQYWDHCIRDEEDFYKHFNYIHNNPIKHKKVKNIEELNKYTHSSYNSWIKKKGREWINDSFREYSILDYSEDK